MHARMLPLVRKGTVVGLLALASGLILFGQASVLTQHNDLSRTGQNVNETILTPGNVSAGNFGKVFSLPVDGQVLAQPLYIPNLAVNGAAHNVVFVATEHDSVYALDADVPAAPLWQASLLDAAHGAAAGATSDPESDTGCNNITPEYGITGTPVIDPVTGTLYVVSVTYENNYPVERLHALDIRTGTEKLGGPVVIAASVAGNGSGSVNGVITFDPKWENQRAGLALVNSSVYVAFASHCDFGSFHGWLMAYNATTLAQTAAFLTTPNGEASGIWMSGAGLAVDTVGGTPRMFVPTGNGSYDATVPYLTNAADYGDDILRLDLSSGIKVVDAFTPYNQASLQAGDTDVASGGVLLLPDQPGPHPHVLVQLGKQNAIYVVDRDNMGGYSTSTNNIVQEIDGNNLHLWGAPAYWNQNVYIWPGVDHLRQYSVSSGMLSAIPTAVSTQTTQSYVGTTPSVSANGTTNGILWAVDGSQATPVVYALDAANVGNTLWNSSANATRDAAGAFAEFTVPTIANGRVYVGGATQVTVYGLLPDFALRSSLTTVNLVQTGSATAVVTVSSLYGFNGAVVLSASNLPAGVTASFVASSTGSGSVATFTANLAGIPGVYPITIKGVSGSLVHSVAFNLTVVGLPNFSLSATPSAGVVQEGGTVKSKIAVVGVYGFLGSPTFSASGLPPGVSASFSPASSSTATTVTLSSSASAWVGTFPINLTATYGSLVRTAAFSLSVTRGLSLSNVQFVNQLSGKCMDVSNISKAVGAMMGQWDCWGGPNQLWNMTAIASGVYRATSVNSGLTLDVSGSSPAVGTRTVQDVYRGLSSQGWSFKATADGNFNLVNGKSGLCLNVAGEILTNGGLVQQAACSGSLGQEWSFVPLSADKIVSLAGLYNVNAIGTNGTASLHGGVDQLGDEFPLAQIGSGFSWYGYNFTFGPANVPDAVSAITVPLPNGQYNGLYLLATAVNGAQANQSFQVNYSDGTSATMQQSLSDWAAPQSYSGEMTVFTSTYKLIGAGTKTNGAFSYYGYGMTLDGTKTAVSIALPPNRNVVVLAITVSDQSPD